MKYCPQCAAPLRQETPPGDNRPRHVCPACGCVHYQNPKLVVGSLPVWEGRVLLCRRAIEPAYGKWTLPAGFMENDETTAQAALRETTEEACAKVVLDGLYTLTSIPRISQVHLIYRARLLSQDFAPGDETLETRLFHETKIPWDDIAFHSVALTLQHYFADIRTGLFPLHEFTLDPLAFGDMPAGSSNQTL